MPNLAGRGAMGTLALLVADRASGCGSGMARETIPPT
jgi:hypothetical protein